MSKQAQKKKTVKFTEAELALIDQGIAQAKKGEFLTEEQAHELAQQNTQARMSITPTQ